MRRSRLLILFALALPMALMAASKPHVQKVYMFGFAASFTDSIAHQTEVQALDSAWVEGKYDFLVDRSLYSLQLQYYVESKLKNTNSICAVFYHKNPRKVQKMWRKVKKRYEKAEGLVLKQITKSDFAFTPEKYKPVTNEAIPVQGGDAPAAGTSN